MAKSVVVVVALAHPGRCWEQPVRILGEVAALPNDAESQLVWLSEGRQRYSVAGQFIGICS